MKRPSLSVQLLLLTLMLPMSSSADSPVFPHKMPTEKPDIPMSSAVERMFDYPTPRVQDNPLFSQFKYTRLEGFDYANGDGTISRRDPSRPILVDGTYYVYYTKRDTIVPPIGSHRAAEATDEIPSTDWDLCEIWYATSTDGFTWQEQGVAVPRPPKPELGWRSVSTPDVLVWENKYYLYYQAFVEPSGTKGDWCPVTVSWADSPEGPWTPIGRQVMEFGQPGEWDQDAQHDPQPLVRDGKVHLYYKAAYNKWPDIRDKYAVGNGLGIADHPFGPFEKHPLNPVVNSGHETIYFPFKEGIATILLKDGNERSTIQYAADGVNFEIASVISLGPNAGAPYSPDAFTDTKDSRGVTWGLSHFVGLGGRGKTHSIIARFDCDLTADGVDPSLKSSRVGLSPDVFFSKGLSAKQRERIAAENDQELSR